MKIMYVIHSLTIGGAETIAVNYLIQLKRNGQDVVLLQMNDKQTFLNQKLDEADVRVLTVNKTEEKGVFGKITAILRMRSLVTAEKPDILHVHTGLEKFRYLHFPAKRIVYTVHSEWSRCIAQGKNHRKMLFRLINEGISVIVLSEKARMDVLKQFPSAKVYRIPNGFDIEKIREQRYDKSTFLHELRIPKDNFILGHVGRFHSVKNHEKVISVFAKVLEKKPNAHLLLVGTGNPEEVTRIQKLVKESAASERIHLLGERKDAVSVMSTFDCLILPSHSEAFPLVLIEAQALEINTVVSVGVPEEVCLNKNCFRLSLDEPDDVWAEDVLRDGIAENSDALSQYDIQNVIERHLELYSVLCEKKDAH